MERWEYLTVQLEKSEKKLKVFSTNSILAVHLSEQLKEYGQQGWELVSQFCPQPEMTLGFSGASGIYATFKRKVIS